MKVRMMDGVIELSADGLESPDHYALLKFFETLGFRADGGYYSASFTVTVKSVERGDEPTAALEFSGATLE